MQIGIAGLGRMGVPIALRLMEAGHQLIVWNRSAEKAKPVIDAGASLAANPAELAAQADTVITVLTDAAAIEAVYQGPSGLLKAAVRTKLFIDMSTVRPQTQTALAAKVRAAGAAFVECPVSGSAGPARQGKLIGLMGGEPADVERARAILEQLCRRLEHLGPVGSGSTMKLAINLPLMIYWQAFGEALSMCRDLNIEPSRLIDLFADTSGGANALKTRGPVIAAMLGGSAPGAAAFDIESGAKDLRTMLAEGEARGLALPLTERALACFDQAREAGWGQYDGSSLPVYWSNRNKQR